MSKPFCIATMKSNFSTTRRRNDCDNCTRKVCRLEQGDMTDCVFPGDDDTTISCGRCGFNPLSGDFCPKYQWLFSSPEANYEKWMQLCRDEEGMSI